MLDAGCYLAAMARFCHQSAAEYLYIMVRVIFINSCFYSTQPIRFGSSHSVLGLWVSLVFRFLFTVPKYIGV